MSAGRGTGIVASLKARGFDRSHATPFERGARVGCSQCQAVAICGVACHERGCPNIVPMCRECGGLDSERICCTPAEWPDDEAGADGDGVSA